MLECSAVERWLQDDHILHTSPSLLSIYPASGGSMSFATALRVQQDKFANSLDVIWGKLAGVSGQLEEGWVKTRRVPGAVGHEDSIMGASLWPPCPCNLQQTMLAGAGNLLLQLQSGPFWLQDAGTGVLDSSTCCPCHTVCL